MLDISEDGRTWVLSGPASSYAVHVTERDELLHLHWGPRIGLADAEALAVRPLPDYWPFESPLDGREEYPVEGGPRFVRPALSVRTAGRRGTEWVHAGHETEDGELRLRFRGGGPARPREHQMRGARDVVGGGGGGGNPGAARAG
ncbi:glycoside hydrolase family 36 N-terminal domain-containing protein, partial [Streptomyces luteogriseus]